MGGWETVTAIIGVAAVIGSTWASIIRGNRKSEPVESSAEARFTRLEGDIEHIQESQKRIETAQQDATRRHEEVVDGIYAAIDDLRKEVVELIKRNRT